MLSDLRKLAVPLALLLAMFFFAGVTGVPVVLASVIEVDQCCDKESAPEFPVDEGECFNCGCLSCLVVLHAPGQASSTPVLATSAYLLLYSDDPPSGYPRLIDYPPEIS